jgi:hypothetical protein
MYRWASYGLCRDAINQVSSITLAACQGAAIAVCEHSCTSANLLLTHYTGRELKARVLVISHRFMMPEAGRAGARSIPRVSRRAREGDRVADIGETGDVEPRCAQRRGQSRRAAPCRSA